MGRFVSLASGSGGNAALFSVGNTHLLIDAGVSFRRLREGLRRFDVSPEELTAVLLTHEHTDHTKGLSQLLRHTSVRLCTTRGTACRLSEVPPDRIRYITAGDRLTFGAVEAEVVSTLHDTAESIGFVFRTEGRKFAFFTDIGAVTPALRSGVAGAECVFLEANHDVERLLRGPYPERLKQRILGRGGHLSNEDCAALICQAGENLRRVTLCHLSEENNTPALAACAVLDALSAAGMDEVRVTVAPPDRPSVPYEF